jgi:hypothetical protein
MGEFLMNSWYSSTVPIIYNFIVHSLFLSARYEHLSSILNSLSIFIVKFAIIYFMRELYQTGIFRTLGALIAYKKNLTY